MSQPERPDSPRAEPVGPQPIPYSVVLDLFGQLTLAYGQPFLARYDGVQIGAVHEDWRYKLAGLSPGQLAWGLDHVQPGRPPEAMTFRHWCEAMPDPDPAPALPPPRGKVAVPPQVREAMDALLHRPKQKDPMRVAIARRYIGMWSDKPNLSPKQRQDLAFYRRVLERYETVARDETARAKQEVQQRVDQYQQEQGHASVPAEAPSTTQP